MFKGPATTRVDAGSVAVRESQPGRKHGRDADRYRSGAHAAGAARSSPGAPQLTAPAAPSAGRVRRLSGGRCHQDDSQGAGGGSHSRQLNCSVANSSLIETLSCQLILLKTMFSFILKRINRDDTVFQVNFRGFSLRKVGLFNNKDLL